VWGLVLLVHGVFPAMDEGSIISGYDEMSIG